MQAPQDQDVFQADRSLLNPTFEAYKLLTGGVTSKTYRLPSAVNHPEQPQGLHVSRKVLQDQAGLNHLVPAASSSSHVCAYIDDSGFVVLIDLSDVTKPTFHPLRCLDLPDDDSYSQQMSLVALPGDQWLAAGAGARIELLQAKKQQQGGRWAAELLAVWRPYNFDGRLIQARRSSTDPHVILALVQGIRTTRAGDANKLTGRSTHKTTFEVALLELRLPPKEEGAEQSAATTPPKPTLVKPTWIVCGDHPVYHCQLGPSADSQHLLVAESTFLEPEKHAAAAAPKPTTTNATPSTTAASGIAVKQKTSTSTTRPRLPRPPPLFTWHQTPDTVTLIFPLPLSVNKSDVRVHFSPPSGLSVHLAPHADLSGEGAVEGRASKKAKIVELREGEDEEMQEGKEGEEPAVRTAHALQEGRYANRTLWAPIDTSGCVWTWERVNTTKSSSGQPAQQQQQGLLTIFLEKKDEGTRWAGVFDEAERRRKANDAEGEDDDEDDPPETQDSSDLLSMVQNMDKYTVDVDEADDGGENPLFNTQRDSLLHDGLEAEDADVGRPACVTFVSSMGEGEGEGVVVVSRPQDQRQASCLARPLPASSEGEWDGPLVIRRDLDGLVFTPLRQDEQAWHHLTTLPALSFVLASKRDLRAVYVASAPPPTTPTSSAGRTAVLAFEDAPRVAGESVDPVAKSAGNLFVYYTAEETKARNAPSRVIRLGDSGGEGTGCLMGAAALSLPPPTEGGGGGGSSGSKRILVVLCERALLVLRGVLDDEDEQAEAS